MPAGADATDADGDATPRLTRERSLFGFARSRAGERLMVDPTAGDAVTSKSDINNTIAQFAGTPSVVALARSSGAYNARTPRPSRSPRTPTSLTSSSSTTVSVLNTWLRVNTLRP